MKRAAGFSLIELMISLLLGLIIVAGVIQVFVSTRATNSLNQAIAEVQEYGRFITLRLQDELREVGRYDSTITEVEDSVDLVLEASFVQRQPVALAGDYTAAASLGSAEGAPAASDELVVNFLASEDCTGNDYGMVGNEELHIVNHYYIDGTQLKCIGYNGRYLRGLAGNATPSSAVVLLDGVSSMQIEYGISADVNDNDSRVVRYVEANQLAAARVANQQVVSIRLAFLIQSAPIVIQNTASSKVALLSESAITLDNEHYYQVFTVAVSLRNSLNYVGSAAL